MFGINMFSALLVRLVPTNTNSIIPAWTMNIIIEATKIIFLVITLQSYQQMKKNVFYDRVKT